MNVLKQIPSLEDAFGEHVKSLRLLQFRLFEIFTAAAFSEVIPPLKWTVELSPTSLLKAELARFIRCF